MDDEKILITGLTGQVAAPIARSLAMSNDVWGLARFTGAGSRDTAEQAGITTVVGDIATTLPDDLPTDFTRLIHFAAFQGHGIDYDLAMTVNAESTGLLMHHCRSARSALIASTFSVYEPHLDPWHCYTETDPLGEAHLVHAPTYSTSKIGQEAVARTMARVCDLPTTIARINVAYGPSGGLPSLHLASMVDGQPINLRAPAPTPYSPIHETDLVAQTPSLLRAAGTPALIVNWCGDEVVTAEDWCRSIGESIGHEPVLRHTFVSGSQPGVAGDPSRRRSITGPCLTSWRDGLQSVLGPERR